MDGSAPHTLRLVLPAELARDDVRALAGRLAARLGMDDAEEVVVDVRSVCQPDVVHVDALGCITLVTRRYGCRVRLIGATPRLRELLAFVGLDDVLFADGSVVESHRKTEHREQPVDVEVCVDPSDPVA